MEILVEYDGPQLVLFDRALGECLLGLLMADQPDGLCRYLIVRLDHGDMASLVDGSLHMRTIFDRAERAIVEADYYGAWKTDPRTPVAGDIPDGMLPVPGHPLPTFVREFLAERGWMKGGEHG
jgi:hypothetical protein